MPALATTASSRPWRRTAVSTAIVAWSGSRTSATTGVAPVSAAIASISSARWPSATTVAPRLTSSRVVAAPMPRPAPVTTATVPVSCTPPFCGVADRVASGGGVADGQHGRRLRRSDARGLEAHGERGGVGVARSEGGVGADVRAGERPGLDQPWSARSWHLPEREDAAGRRCRHRERPHRGVVTGDDDGCARLAGRVVETDDVAADRVLAAIHRGKCGVATRRSSVAVRRQLPGGEAAAREQDDAGGRTEDPG